jgi:hypothetical protein
VTTYQFQAQLDKGEQAEAQLDRYFAEWLHIRPATRDEQRQGIDRIYTDRCTGNTLKVEYKTDWTAGRTGNAFVETISVDTTNKPGWAYTSKADVLVYYVPGDELIYWIRFADLRRHLVRWAQKYEARKIPNRGYHTHGLLVPLSEFERIAKQVICL